MIVWENKKLLLAIDASAINKWVCAAIKQIFTKEELKDGDVCGENSTSNYKQIDSARIELLEEALFIKYKVQKQIKIKIQYGKKCVK